MHDSKDIVVQEGDANIGNLTVKKVYADYIYSQEIGGKIGGALYASRTMDDKSRAVSYELTTGKPNMYFCNNLATPYISTGADSTALAHVQVKTSDNKTLILLDTNNAKRYVSSAMATTEIAGAIKSGTQQWISSAAINRNSTSIWNIVVQVKSGNDYWQGTFSLLPRNNWNSSKAKTAFIMPYSSTDYAVCQAYLITDSTEGTVNSLKINLDNMTLADGYTVSVYWYDVVAEIK